jgi:hypothetical protein
MLNFAFHDYCALAYGAPHPNNERPRAEPSRQRFGESKVNDTELALPEEATPIGVCATLRPIRFLDGTLFGMFECD